MSLLELTFLKFIICLYPTLEEFGQELLQNSLFKNPSTLSHAIS